MMDSNQNFKLGARLEILRWRCKRWVWSNFITDTLVFLHKSGKFSLKEEKFETLAEWLKIGHIFNEVGEKVKVKMWRFQRGNKVNNRKFNRCFRVEPPILIGVKHFEITEEKSYPYSKRTTVRFYQEWCKVMGSLLVKWRGSGERALE